MLDLRKLYQETKLEQSRQHEKEVSVLASHSKAKCLILGCCQKEARQRRQAMQEGALPNAAEVRRQLLQLELQRPAVSLCVACMPDISVD